MNFFHPNYSLPRMCNASGVKVIGVSVHIYVCVFVDKKNLNRT